MKFGIGGVHWNSSESFSSWLHKTQVEDDQDHVSMGWDYVSELRPPTGLLFIPPMICVRGDPWGIDIRRGELPIRLPELSGNPTLRVM
jgi:hypothetical protein